jgi:hypothetical protein
MAHRVNDDFRVGRLVEGEIWIGRRRDAPNGGVIGRRASPRMAQEQIGDRANSGLDAENGQRCNPESMQDRRAQEAYNAASQAVLGPHGLHLLVGCEFPAAGGGLGAGNRLALFGRKDDRRSKVGARKLHDGARDVILIV